jgi:hypothetical protein
MREEIFSFLRRTPRLLFIPSSVMKKIKGISEFGQMEETFKGLIREAQEMDQYANFLYLKEMK